MRARESAVNGWIFAFQILRLKDRERLLFRRFITVLSATLWLAGVSHVRADLIVPAGGIVNVNGATIDLACTDLVVGGTLNVAAGSIVNVRNAAILPGGIVDGGSGLIAVGGDWTNNGQLLAGTGTVRFSDLCSLTGATITGSTTFFNARFVSTFGKTYRFAVGSTQTIAGILEIAGSAAQPIQFRSTAAGQVANLALLPAGVQQIQHVGVSDVWATGQWLAPYLTNEGGSGNARRWFGIPDDVVAPIPATDPMTAALLAMLLAATGVWVMRRRQLSGNRRENRTGGSAETGRRLGERR